MTAPLMSREVVVESVRRACLQREWPFVEREWVFDSYVGPGLTQARTIFARGVHPTRGLVIVVSQEDGLIGGGGVDAP